jgi:hypothetical protein
LEKIIIDVADLKFIDDLGDDNIEVGGLKSHFITAGDDIVVNLTGYATINCRKRLKKWLDGPRKLKKKDLGLAKDRRRLIKKIHRGELVSFKDLKEVGWTYTLARRYKWNTTEES